MLIIINNTWNGASAAAAAEGAATAAAAKLLGAPAALIIVPAIVKKNVPAHVGHAVKRPVAAPIPLKQHEVFFVFFLDLLFWNTYNASVMFTLTRVDSTTVRIRFIGITNTIRLSDM